MGEGALRTGFKLGGTSPTSVDPWQRLGPKAECGRM